MFTGIIETVGSVTGTERDGGNQNLEISCVFTAELKVDQSVAHNGVCLTVVGINGDRYRVTAVRETLERSNLGSLIPGSRVNLERAMISGMRLDGHMVQGHVDTTARCTSIEAANGSWMYGFEFMGRPEFLLVEKGSVCVDGVSLTVAALIKNGFTAAIIPYTYEHTIFKEYRKESLVNIEFDVIGKYVHRYMERFSKTQPSNG